MTRGMVTKGKEIDLRAVSATFPVHNWDARWRESGSRRAGLVLPGAERPDDEGDGVVFVSKCPTKNGRIVIYKYAKIHYNRFAILIKAYMDRFCV